MRITNLMLSQGARSGIASQMRAIQASQERATTGIRVNRPSDDPVANAGIMQSSSGLRALEQYKRNLETGQARLRVEDSALEQIGSALARAKELAISQGDEAASAATRAAVQAEVEEIVDFLKDLANTQLAGIYVFGGQYADTPPYQGGVLDPAKPPSGDLQIEVGAGQYVATSHSAQEIFVDSGAVGAVQALADALGANDVDAIRSAIPGLDQSFDSIQELVGDLGARMNSLDVTVANLDSLEVNLQTFRAGLSDADLAEAVTDLVNRQGSLEAAMLANSRILNLTMTDYLR